MNGYKEVYSKRIEGGSQGCPQGTLGIYTDTYKYIPMVLFVGQTEPMLVEPHEWESKLEPSVSRSQIPLVLAWAVTTHKIQGATLDCALIDIGDDVFEYGQAYVALSRVKSLDSLYVFNLKPSCVRAHPLVKDYYDSMKLKEAPCNEDNPTELANDKDIPPRSYFAIFNAKKK